MRRRPSASSCGPCPRAGAIWWRPGSHDAVRFLAGLALRRGRGEPARPGGAVRPRLSRLAPGGCASPGRVRAVPEGRIVFASEPLLEIDAPFARGPAARDRASSPSLTFATAVATKAARCREAAGGRTLVDFGLRRAHGGDAGMTAARGGGHRRVRRHLQRGRRRPLRPSGQRHHGPLLRDGHGRQRPGRRARRLPLLRRALPRATPSSSSTPGTPPAGSSTPSSWPRSWPPASGRATWAGGRRLAGIRLDSGDVVALARLARQRLDAAGLARRRRLRQRRARRVRDRPPRGRRRARSTASASAPTSPPRPTPRRWRASTSWWPSTAGPWPSARPARPRCPAPSRSGAGRASAATSSPWPTSRPRAPGAEAAARRDRPRRRAGRARRRWPPPGSGSRPTGRHSRSSTETSPTPPGTRCEVSDAVTSLGGRQLRPRMTAKSGPVRI